MKTAHPHPTRFDLMACICVLLAFGAGSARAGGPAIAMATGNGVAVSSAHSSAPVTSGALSAGPRVGISGGSGRTGNLVSTGGLNAGRINNPAAFRSTRSGLLVTPTATQSGGAPANNAQTVAPPRAHNAWTDPSPSITSRTTGNRHYDRNFSGTILYPGAPRDVPGDRFGTGNAFAGGRYGNGSRFHFRHRGYSYPYGYYSPYALYGGYPTYIDNDLASVGTDAGVYSNVPGDSNALSADAVTNLSRPYPSETANVTPLPPDADAVQPPPPQTPANPSLRSNSGPDSLVEAVQAELSRRGYFGGKVDAVYNEATHTAIQRFQSDQQLPATGRINEATLHALQLD